MKAFRDALLRLLLVPPEPSIPGGSDRVRIFRAAPAYYRYRLVLWFLAQAAAGIGLIFGLIAIAAALRLGDLPRGVEILLTVTELLAWVVFVVQLPVTLAIVHLDFELRWYILSDRSLRIREGIVAMREKTMTFANIQNVEVRQNPLQRILRIADVRVRSAGGGSGTSDSHGQMGDSLHEASFHGVDNAEEIRAAIAERVRLHRDAGLGDPDDDHYAEAGDQTPELLTAARQLLEETTRLRKALG
jgi:uncharacterized membrane protein YdbT with pleckstrin-like domain